MSGGSFDYVYQTLLENCKGRMEDIELNDMIIDLSKLLHSLEWWQSSDSNEKQYRDIVNEFKGKWFSGSRNERLKGYIDTEIKVLEKKLYELVSCKKENQMKYTIEELIEDVQVVYGCLGVEDDHVVDIVKILKDKIAP